MTPAAPTPTRRMRSSTVRLIGIVAVGLILSPIGCLWAGTARADMQVILIDEQSLPYNLSPSNYNNSPSNYSNSSANYENSEANYTNSPANYSNSSANYQNSLNGNRRIINDKNEFIGYYVFTENNRMNVFNAAGKRIGYVPGGGNTSSVFSENAWCGTLGENNGRTVLGLSVACYRRFLFDR